MTTPAAEIRTAWDLVRRGPFSRLWWAGVIGSTGDWITIFAILVVGNAIAGSTGTLVAILSRLLPGLIFGPFAGVFTDRLNRKRLIVVAEFGRAAVVPLLAFVDTLPELIMVTLVLEVLSLLGQAPRAAIVPSLVSQPNLVAANSLTLAAVFGTVPLAAFGNWLLGWLPAISLGGWIPIANEGIALAFFVDSLTFLISGVMVSTIPIAPEDAVALPPDDGKLGFKTSVHDLLDGLGYIWRHRDVRRVLVGLGVGLFGGGAIVSLGPRFVEQVLGADSRGFFAVVAALAFGAALGIAGVSLFGSRLGRRDFMFGTLVLVGGIGLMFTALTKTVGGASAWASVMGVGSGGAYVMGFTHLHEQVEDGFRGRIFATMYVLIRVGLFASAAIAVPLAGFFRKSTWLSPFNQPARDVIFLGGAVMALTGLVTVWRVVRSLGPLRLDEAARRALSSTAQYRPARPGIDRTDPDHPPASEALPEDPIGGAEL